MANNHNHNNHNHHNHNHHNHHQQMDLVITDDEEDETHESYQFLEDIQNQNHNHNNNEYQPPSPSKKKEETPEPPFITKFSQCFHSNPTTAKILDLYPGNHKTMQTPEINEILLRPPCEYISAIIFFLADVWTQWPFTSPSIYLNS